MAAEPDTSPDATLDTPAPRTIDEGAHPGDGYVIRQIHMEDAKDVWELVNADPVIDDNSAYAYIMSADFFGDTFLIARDEHGRLAGYVLAVPRPDNSAVFVWQITVAEHARRKRLGHRLLEGLMRVANEKGIDTLQATVAPPNEASARMFKKFAETSGAGCEITPGYTPELFPGEGATGEELYTIRPVKV